MKKNLKGKFSTATLKNAAKSFIDSETTSAHEKPLTQKKTSPQASRRNLKGLTTEIHAHKIAATSHLTPAEKKDLRQAEIVYDQVTNEGLKNYHDDMKKWLLANPEPRGKAKRVAYARAVGTQINEKRPKESEYTALLKNNLILKKLE